MSDAHGNWWMDARSRWHQGEPPPGWWQAPDGRWHLPTHDDPTEETEVALPTGAAHLARADRPANLLESYRNWPRWARLAGPVAGTILALAVLGAAATEGLREDRPDDIAIGLTTTTTTEPATTTSSGGATTAATATMGDTTATTTALPDITAPAPPDPTSTTVAAPPPPPPTSVTTHTDIHPGAPCSPEGATAVSADGIPLTCTREKCHGAPYSEPRWRRTEC